jgi:chromosome condensin MukBEF complex kleisin-like MukF subunit
MRLGYKPTHIERQNAIKQFLDKSWINTYDKPHKLSEYRYEQLALLQDNVISLVHKDFL